MPGRTAPLTPTNSGTSSGKSAASPRDERALRRERAHAAAAREASSPYKRGGRPKAQFPLPS